MCVIKKESMKCSHKCKPVCHYYTTDRRLKLSLHFNELFFNVCHSN